MTTSVSEKDRIAALAAGMDAFEEKPIFIDKLFETIGRFLHPEG
jgi:CheY-like chemotaxis protein